PTSISTPFIFATSPHLRHLHSFPTRRSSDLGEGQFLCLDEQMHILGALRSHRFQIVRLQQIQHLQYGDALPIGGKFPDRVSAVRDRKSTRLNSSHVKISYAVFCLKKKKQSYA